MRGLRLSLQAELLAVFGTGPAYHAACREVGPAPLAAALGALRQRQRDAVRDISVMAQLAPSDPATVTIADRTKITVRSGPEAVALAHLIACGEVGCMEMMVLGEWTPRRLAGRGLPSPDFAPAGAWRPCSANNLCFPG